MDGRAQKGKGWKNNINVSGRQDLDPVQSPFDLKMQSRKVNVRRIKQQAAICCFGFASTNVVWIKRARAGRRCRCRYR